MIKFYPIVVTILGFALPAGETPSVIAVLGASGNPRYGGVNPTKLEDGGKNKKVHGLKGWTAEFIELHPDTLGGRDAIQSTVKDDISKDKTVSIATILGFHTTEPSSKGMLAKICARDVEDTTDPLDMVERARTFLNELRAETGMTKVAIPTLGENVVVGERDEKEEDGEGGIALAKKDHVLVKGKMVATTLSPTNLMCSALKACSTSHVDALGEGEEGGASAFEEAERGWKGWIAEKQGCVLNVSPLSFAATACSASVIRSDSDDLLDEVKKVAYRDRSLMGAETPWEDRAPGQSKMSTVVLFPSKMTNKSEANIKLVDGRVFNSVLAIVDASFSIVAEDLSTSEETLKAAMNDKYDATATLFDDDSVKSVPAISHNAICKVLTYPNKIHEHQIMMTGKTNGAFSEYGPEQNSRNIALLFGTPALKRQRPENNAWHPVFKGESAGGYRVSSKAYKSPAHSTHLECNIAVLVQTSRFCFSIKLPTIERATCGGTSAEENNSGSLNSEGTCVISGNKLHVTTAHRCNFSDASYDLLESSSDEIIWSELEDGLGDDVFICSCASWFQADTDDIVYISLRSKIMSIIGSSQTIMDDAYKHVHSMLNLANTGSVLSHWLLAILISFAFALIVKCQVVQSCPHVHIMSSRLVCLLGLSYTVLFARVSHALNITGDIAIADTTSWKSAASPVHVTGIISVLSGGTLLIESGVTCIFEDAVSGIIVRSGGQLLITGVENNRVFLQARLESWAGITFLTGSKSAEFGVDDEYVSGSIIQNANISRAGYSRSSGLSLSEGAAPYLNNIGMFDCGAIVIRDLRGSFVANKLSIMRMGSFTGPVIDIRGTGMNSGRTILHEVVVQARSGYSLFIANIHFASVAQSSFNGEVRFQTVEKVTVENNIIAPYSPTNRNAIYMTGIASEASSISRNHLFSRIYVDDSSITIAENIIQESVIGGIMVIMRNGGDAIHILNNTITKCKPSSDVVSLIFAAGSLHFANNMIAENQGQHVFSLEAEQSSGSLQFANNTIVQNHARTIFYLMGRSRTYITTRNILSNVVSSNIGTEALLELYGFPLGSFAENLFANNSAPMSVDVNMPDHDEDTIELPRNYWGEFQADVVDLRASVGDILTTKSLGPIVDFNPVLKDFSAESDLIPVNLPGLFMSDGSIGGVVRNKSLTLAGGHFIANMSIVIIDGGSLEIGPNSTVSFALSRAIVVKNSGKLDIAGLTTLRAKDASKFWNGIHIQTSNATSINGSFIRDASVGIRTTQQSSGLLSIYNAEFENVLVGLQLESNSPLAAVSLTLVNISSSSGSGIDARSFRGRLNVTNSTISSNTRNGLISNYGHDLVLIHNSIDTRSSSYTSLVIQSIDKSAIVTGNKITCLASCLTLTVRGSHTRVDDNVFSGAGVISGSSQARIVMEVYTYNSFSVQGNSFSNWNSPSNDAVYVQLQQGIGNHTIRLSSNDFRGIKARRVLYLDFLSSATPTNIANVFDQSLVVTDSVFYIQNWPKSCGSATCTLVGNIFNSSLSLGQHHIWISESANSVASIDASLSYWGSEDESKVVGSIYDGRDNVELTTIDYLPYLLTPDPAGNRSTNETSLTFLRQGNILSGILGKGENVTLYFTGSPYKTDGTLIIDGYLEIKANVTIQVKDGSSILIRRNGTMKAIGTADMPILFENLDAERWAGLVVEGVADLQHIDIREGGHGGDFCLTIKRPSSFVYKNIRIQEGMGNGLSVEGDGEFAFENLRIESTTPSLGSPRSVHIAGQERTNVDINGLFISTSHSGHAIWARDIPRLSIKNAEIYPLSVLSDTPSLYLAAGSYELDNFVFKASSQTHSASIVLVAKDGSITNSSIIGTGLIYVDVRDGYVKINNVTFVGTNINANANNVSFVKNSFSGSTNINANANNVSFVKNSFSGSTNNPSHCVNSHSKYFEATSNEVTNYTSHSDQWLIDASYSVLLGSNAFENCHVRGQYSLFAIRSSDIAIKDNILSNVTARAIVQFLGSINSINFIGNAIIDPHVQFYMMTSSSYASVADGTLKIGPNFWSTTSFEELNLGAFDSSYDSSLATIEFLSLFIDRRMEDIIFAPSSQVFDKDRKRISGTIADDLVIVVPPGLYYAPGSIILRHPKAQLVIMAGAHIIFAEYASIRVDQGALKILGDDRSSVYLTPTSAAQYNDTIENSTIFDGILFGPNSNGTVFGDNMEYVAGSIIRHCEVKYGGYYKSSATIRLDEVSVMLDHVTIIGQWGRRVDGILFIRPSGPVFLRGVNISNVGGSGIVVSEAKTISSFADVNIHGCYREGLVIGHSRETVIVSSTFDGNGESSQVNSQVYSYGGTGDFNVTSCLFVNSKDVGFESIYHSSWPGSRRYSVTSSNFTQLQRPIFIDDASSIEFAMNRFYNNSCTLSSCQSIAILFHRDFIFRGNVVEDNSASQILRIKANSGANSVPNIAIAGNIFQSNQVPSYSYSSSSAVLAMSGNTNSTWHLQGNEFNNPLSLYEMRTSEFSVSDPKFVKINATYNIFAIADEDNPSATLIDSRIYDDDEGPYPVVSFEPYLNRSYTAACISNCTDHGLCVYPGICICRNGWSGESCDVPTCSTLKFCNGHGKCSAFEKCTCDKDWLGSSCDIANCTLQSNCNNNGFCPVPNICSCFTGYDGIECDECVSNYRMTNGSCVPCPVCRNGGLCSVEAKCACPFNYVGHTCESCAEGYFGVACLPLPFILDALPTDASDTGGIEIRLVGYNFASDRAANTSVLYGCRFGSIAKVNATLISDNELACVSPKVQLSNGLMEVDLSVTVDSQASYNSVPFVFYGLCPENQCSHGYCSFGRCVCHYGYRGDDCSDELIAPIITSPHTVIELLEGKPFSYQLQINQGSKPIQWALIGKPINGIVLDAISGVISWTSPTASSDLFYVKVQATNELSRSDAIDFVFHVSPSYYVEVSTAPVSYTRPSPIVYFDVLTLDVSTNGPIGDVPAVFWVQEQGSLGHRRKVTVKTNPFGAQRGSYQPYSTDAGVFLYGGEHPMCTNLTVQGQIMIMGVDVIPNYYYFRGFPFDPQSIESAFLFRFKGGSFSGIDVTFDQGNDFSIVPSLNSSTANATSDTLAMSLNISSSTGLRGRVYFNLSTTEGLYISSSYVFMDIKYRTPILDLSSDTIDVKAEAGGAPKYYDVMLQNVGTLASGSIEVIFATDGCVRPVSENIPALAVDEVTLVSFRVLIPENTAVGTVFVGEIGFVSNNSDTVILEFRVTTISSVSTTLTIITQNEATFFSEEKSNLNDVDVRVRSLTVDTVYMGNSGTDGTIIFTDMVEDFYEIIAQKSGHTSFTRRIFLESPGQIVEAFLSFESVSYTFRVVPISVVDRYKIIVESTFTTHVPKPVILWEPLLLDFELLRSGHIDSFHMSATNVGLIAADNLTFWLPAFWENVAFITPKTKNLGRLSANSTLSFPVEVSQINRYEIPQNMTEMRDPLNPNNVIFLPVIDDARWDTGLDVISISADNPTKPWYYKFDTNGRIEFVYRYSDRTRYDFIYDNQTKIPSDIIITNNTNLTDTRKLSVDVPPPVLERRLGIVNFKDCACVTCKMLWELLLAIPTKGQSAPLKAAALRALKNRKVYQKMALKYGKTYDDIMSGADNFKASKYWQAYEGICDQMDRIKSIAEVELPAGVKMTLAEIPFEDFAEVFSLPKKLGDKLMDFAEGVLDPCQYICPEDETVGGGCAYYDCGGKIVKICMPELSFPSPGDCYEIEPQPATNWTLVKPPKPIPPPTPPCPRCGEGYEIGTGSISNFTDLFDGLFVDCKYLGTSLSRAPTSSPAVSLLMVRTPSLVVSPQSAPMSSPTGSPMSALTLLPTGSPSRAATPIPVVQRKQHRAKVREMPTTSPPTTETPISRPATASPTSSPTTAIDTTGTAPRRRLFGCEECSPADLKVAFQETDNRQEVFQEVEVTMIACIEKARLGARSLFPCIFRSTIELVEVAPLLSSVISCQLSREVCYDHSDLMDSPGLINLFLQAKRFESMIDLMLLPYSGSLHSDPFVPLNFDNIQAITFGKALDEALADSGESGEFISNSELYNLLSMGLTVPSELDIKQFANTWNQSLIFWNQGIFSASDLPTSYSDPFFDLKRVKALMSAFWSAREDIQSEHYVGIGDAWLTAVEGQQYEESRKLAGVCAAVRIRIEQELTLTRIGFEARLEISNGGDSDLENVTVSLKVSPFGKFSEDATSLFVFDEAVLAEVTSLAGGVISAGAHAKVTWLILPLTEAAPTFDIKYDIGGVLRYSIEGIDYIQYLAPDTITVKPDPQLFLKYFYSREVFADDPFTAAVEPSIPYHLALLIENRGYGDAFDVRILSSQPEIVENEKGLLVDFNIIGSRLGNTSIASRSMNIDFGIIPSRSKSVGVWDMVSSIRGKFNNFTATFQYEGPINDDKLSIIESVEVFELSHVVRVDGNHVSSQGYGYIDDGFDDFLVNTNPDAYYIPDHVFTSDMQHSNLTVASVVDKSIIHSIDHVSLNQIVVTVHHSLTGEERSLLSDWVYIRFDNPVSESNYILDRVFRTDVNYTLLPNYNSWQTSWTEYLSSGKVVEQEYIHIFDFGVAQEYKVFFTKQMTPVNLHVIGSTESSISVAWGSHSNDTHPTGISFMILIKRSMQGDEHYKVVKSFLPGYLSSYTVRGLASETSYSVKVMSGQNGYFEKGGVEVVGNTIGNSGPVGDKPSENPSVNPSSNPSENPSDNPSSNPSENPSENPSSNPSENPSDNPSSNPSENPSDNPSSNPSKNPSENPSSNPSENPSENPSSNPSENPSENPISSPSENPSGSPTKAGNFPTQKPTHKPNPNKKPSTTHKPNPKKKSPSTHKPNPNKKPSTSHKRKKKISQEQ